MNLRLTSSRTTRSSLQPSHAEKSTHGKTLNATSIFSTLCVLPCVLGDVDTPSDGFPLPLAVQPIVYNNLPTLHDSLRLCFRNWITMSCFGVDVDVIAKE